VFIPGVSDEPLIARLVDAVDAPLNVLFSPSGPPLSRLAELGVRRVSSGSLLFRVALGAAVDAATAIRADRFVAIDGVPSYAEVEALV
jgi:2-methylisocitrate lyase-like PEP mutase family enzyme